MFGPSVLSTLAVTLYAALREVTDSPVNAEQLSYSFCTGGRVLSRCLTGTPRAAPADLAAAGTVVRHGIHKLPYRSLPGTTLTAATCPASGGSLTLPSVVQCYYYSFFLLCVCGRKTGDRRSMV